MEWLKAILEKAQITDGKLDIDAVMNAAKAEFPKHAVPKTDFNAKADKLKAAEDTITALKKDAGDNAELQKTIDDYKERVKTLETEAANTAKSYALKTELTEAGVLDPDYVIYKQGGLEKFTFDKDGKPLGIDDILKPLKESSAYLFKAKEGAGGYKPNGGGKPPVTNPFDSKTFNLTEQGRLLREDPTRARELAAEAGVSLAI